MEPFSICLFIWHLLKVIHAAIYKLCSVHLLCFIVVRATNIPQFIHSTVGGYFSLQFRAFTNNIACEHFFICFLLICRHFCYVHT